MRPARAMVAAATAALALAVVIASGAAAAAVPVLGGNPGIDTKGFGRSQPSQIIYGATAQTFNLTHVRWKHWGAAQAYGTAKGWYVPRSAKSISGGHVVTVRLVAYALGTCRGKRAYTLMAEYVPSLGQRFHPNRRNDDRVFCNTP